jgi:6-phosphofructokinase 1
MYKQIGILTGGGDAPGLNAVIRSVVRTAVGEYGMKCIGIEDSFEGILGEPHTNDADAEDRERHPPARWHDLGNSKSRQLCQNG